MRKRSRSLSLSLSFDYLKPELIDFNLLAKGFCEARALQNLFLLTLSISGRKFVLEELLSVSV